MDDLALRPRQPVYSSGCGGVKRTERILSMPKRILITGGAGFVGSHIADALLADGHEVAIFDSLSPQVHAAGLPDYLSPRVEFIAGDMRDLDAVRRAVRDVDVIFHMAAAVGVGQSMYEISNYVGA